MGNERVYRQCWVQGNHLGTRDGYEKGMEQVAVAVDIASTASPDDSDQGKDAYIYDYLEGLRFGHGGEISQDDSNKDEKDLCIGHREAKAVTHGPDTGKFSQCSSEGSWRGVDDGHRAGEYAVQEAWRKNPYSQD